MRYLVGLVGGLIVALLFPVFANAQTTACQLLDLKDIEQITWLKFEPGESQRLNECAGLCDSLDGWRCSYRMSGENAPGQIFVEIHLPPFLTYSGKDKYLLFPNDDPNVQIVDVPGFVAPGRWEFRHDQTSGRGILHIDDGDRVRMVVVVEGLKNGNALTDAKGIAQLVLSRFTP